MLRTTRVERLWALTGGSETGSALLTGLYLIMVVSLLGVGFLEIATIEANLVTRDQWDLQAFYCAEAQAARIFNLYDLGCPLNTCKNPLGDSTGALGNQTFSATSLTLANGQFIFSGFATVDPTTEAVTVIATCTLPSGVSRTVRRQATRQFLANPYQYVMVSGGYNLATGAQQMLGDVNLGGNGVPVNPSGGNWVLGADTVNGRVYVAGNVYLRGEAVVNPYSASDTGPRITVYPGGSVTDNSSAFDSSAPGAVTQSTLDPMPALSNAQGTGAIDKIRAAVYPGGSAIMKGTFNGATVYNLTEIFNQLGETSEGNEERNLARPAGCTFGVASSDLKCQIWQDLLIVGPRRTCSPTCATGVIGPTDGPSYFFMGMPRGGGAPQHTAFSDIFEAAVNASAELRQLGFVANSYGTLGTRLDALLGTDIDGEGRARRLLDFTVGIDGSTGQSVMRATPPIFYVDGYWRADGGTSMGYNGVATVVASKSMILSDNILYLGSLANVNTDVATSTGCPNDRTRCGLADMLGLMAKEDIWMGDPGSSGATVHEISAVMLAGRDFNYFTYNSSSVCCQGPHNSTTFNGAVLASRQASLVREWANPLNGHETDACNGATSPCRPVVFYPADTSCGATGCWKFMTLDATAGILTVDTSKPSFKDGCVTTATSPLTPSNASCPAGSRRVTHFQLNVNYDARLMTNGNILPLGLPAAGANAYLGFGDTGTWKDCGRNTSCL